ncbi:uncharacterized protein HD556DRAFT_259240 [Suillus plorans]|uniref:C2H2-type domain-containing protein n=1 Tax=Suillus plorans TaxID=116603 RepID=A0A9P7IYN9_9AGAM|nr:uncharacterized protein HD556DRAFT_259240 [Suillus plorans]KAG1797510.1 hypothetical protein HD556DRAFT_259240 [Suillus plorans]
MESHMHGHSVLMQHQKAKHFKCNMCPRRLNTAGGLAVHIQQVHKLEPEKCLKVHPYLVRFVDFVLFSLPRIENAMPGRDGYEVEIFGMEGIPAPDVADYKRRKEIELGLAAGSISQPQPKRPKIEKRPLSEDELKAQLEAHKALMGAGYTALLHKHMLRLLLQLRAFRRQGCLLVWDQVRLLHSFREGHPLPALCRLFRLFLACPVSFQDIHHLASLCLLLVSCLHRVCFPQVRHLFLPEVFGHHSLHHLLLFPLVQHHRSLQLHQGLDLVLRRRHRLLLWDHPLQPQHHLL